MKIKRRDVVSISEELADFPVVLQRIYAARGINKKSELDKQLKGLLPFTGLKNITIASARLGQALTQKERILVVGDFDADGATSSALAVSSLRAMGAHEVSFLVPNRFEFGYGLTPGIVGVAKEWRPDLIITVDNGIASFDGVLAAREAGIDVLVTDHHLAAETLPEAFTIVNPNQPGDVFQSKSIAGVGVIFYVMLALRQHLRETNWFETQNIPEPNMAQFLDLVALGTVADVVSLDQNNRILVEQGLRRIRGGACRPGIQALINIAKRESAYLREGDLGFAVAPRLNAAGRLDDMSLGIDCLLSETDAAAQTFARELDELNIERRKIEGEMQEKALKALDKLSTLGHAKDLPAVLCLMDKTWHQGVIGILAGRLKERYHRPVIAFAKTSEHELKGSARSIQNINIRDVLAAIDTKNPGLITKFGGHAMAAGLSMPPENFELFQQHVTDAIETELKGVSLEGVVLSDGSLVPQDFNLKFSKVLQQAGPWGQQFQEPVFDDFFEILDQRLVGKNHLKLMLRHEAGGEALDAIAFNIDLDTWPNQRARRLHAAYKLDINVYRGRERLQLMIVSMKNTGALIEDGVLKKDNACAMD
ncbi:MAG: single-stranded-DNA-specific exonuclease RecJ [Gammaproteobacteria bacterium]|nr:single-stranded-DNA-specific exonuclease RecJ [Gammaproteobacteria bacterium]